MSTSTAATPAPTAPARPGRVTLAAAVMTVLAVLIGISGCLLLVGLAFGTFFYLAMGGTAPASLLILGAAGIVMVVLAVVELRAAMLVLRGDRWGRRVALAVSVVGIGYGALVVTRWAGTTGMLGLYAGFIAANLVVIVVLVTSGAWFAAVDASIPAGARRSIARRIAPWLAVLSVVAVLIVAGATSSRVLGDDRPTSYLAALPETRLVYPGATLVDSSSTPAGAWFGTTERATVTSRYEVQATQEAVIDWYAKAFASRDWLRRDINLSSSGSIPTWRKDYADIQLRHAREARPGVTAFSITAHAHDDREDPVPLRRLQALPDLELVYPGSDQQETGEGLGRRTSDHSVQPASVVRRYDTQATPAEVLAFFDRELTAGGWTASGPVSERGERTWVRDGAEFSLHAYDPENRTVNAYEFHITEVPGPDATPFDPWP